MSLKHPSDSDASAEPSSGGATAAWPVLARLPWIGSPGIERIAAPAAAVESTAERPSAPAQAHALRIAEPANASGDLPARAELAALGELPLRHAFSDRTHGSVRGYDWPAATDAAIALETAVRDGAVQRKHYRIDQAVTRAPAAVVAKPRTPAPPMTDRGGGPTLAGRVFQLHATLAPRAGVALTLALLLSAAALWWATIGQGGGSSSLIDAMKAPGAWSSDLINEPHVLEPAPSDAPAAVGYTMPFTWEANAAGHAPTPMCDGQQGCRKPAAASEAARTGPAAPPKVGPAADTSQEDPAKRTLAEKQPAAPAPITPTPSASPYPTTSYAAINFSTESPAAAADGAAARAEVAERAGALPPR